MNPARIVIWVIVGTLLGGVLGHLSNELMLGLIGGALLGWPLGLAWDTKKRRWLAVAALIGTYILAWEVTGPEGLSLTLLCTAITLFMSAAILRDLYQGSEWQAFVHHMKILTGILKGVHVVSEGKSVMPAGDGPVMGPRLVMVKPNTAALVEWGAKHTHILGPGFYTSRPFEYVKYIFNLRPQTFEISIPNVRTRNHLLVTIGMTIVAGIQFPRSVRSGEQNMNDANEPKYADLRKRLAQIYDYHSDWEEATRSEIESQVRRYAAGLTLEEITDATHYFDLARKVVQATNTRVNKWGIRVDRAIVGKIEPARAVTEQMEAQWAQSLRRDAAALDEISQANAWANALQLIAGGYRYARTQGLDQNDINRLVLMRTLERITAQPGVNLHLSAAAVSDLNDLRRALGLQP